MWTTLVIIFFLTEALNSVNSKTKIPRRELPKPNIVIADGYESLYGGLKDDQRKIKHRSSSSRNKNLKPSPKEELDSGKSILVDLSKTSPILFPAPTIQRKKNVRLRSGLAKSEWYSKHFDQLMADIPGQKVNMVKTGADSSYLALFTELAFPIMINSGKVIVAGAEFGKGRVLILARENNFDDSATDSSLAKFVENGVIWVAQKNEDIKLGLAGIEKAGTFSGEKMKPSDLRFGSTVDVFAATYSQSFDDEEIKAIQDFVRSGGGLMMAGESWSWRYSNSDHSSFAFTPNKILMPMGIVSYGEDTFSDETIEYGFPPIEKNTLEAIKTLEKDENNEMALATILHTSEALFQPELIELLTIKPMVDKILEILKKLLEDKPKYSKLYAALVSILFPALTGKRDDHIHKYYDIEEFPFDFDSDSSVKSKKVKINSTIDPPDPYFNHNPCDAKMISTNLYAKAGTVVKIEVPENVVKKFKVRIGSHTDVLNLLKEPLKRSPQVFTDFRMWNEKFSISSPFGGLIYVVIPYTGGKEIFEVTIKGAYDTLYYIHGKTKPEEWKAKLDKNYPPWGELEIPGKLTFTFPTKDFKLLEDPISLAKFYDAGMNEIAKFSGVSKPFCHERIVYDVHIIMAYWHSGYPIMTYMHEAGVSLNLTNLKSDGSWGTFHEIGHNYQWLNGMAGGNHPDLYETTNNWYAIVVNRKLVSKEKAKTIYPEDKILDRIHKWFFDGQKKEAFNSFVALDMFYFPAESFGWPTYTKMMKKLYKMEALPNYDHYYDRWVYHYVELVKFNLCPYFDIWKLPIKPETRDICKKYPNLLESPMKNYYKTIKEKLGEENMPKSEKKEKTQNKNKSKQKQKDKDKKRDKNHKT